MVTHLFLKILILVFMSTTWLMASHASDEKPLYVPSRDDAFSDQKRRYIPPSDYAEAYKKTYTSDDFAERYRENYRTNPIYTGSADPTQRYDFFNFYHDYYRYPYYQNRYYPPYENPYTELDGPRVVIDRNPRPLGVPDIPRSYTPRPYFNINYQTFLRPAALDPDLLAYLEENRDDQEDQTETAEIPEDIADNETKPEVVQNPALRSPTEFAYNNTVDLIEKGNYLQAIEYLETLVQRNSENAKFQKTLAAAYLLRGDYENAAKLANKLKDSPQLPWLNDMPMFKFQIKRLQQQIERDEDDEKFDQLVDLFGLE